jgi:hypothetical protein
MTSSTGGGGFGRLWADLEPAGRDPRGGGYRRDPMPGLAAAITRARELAG